MYVSNSSCCACNSCNDNPCKTKCRSQITSADLADLIYIAGLDENLCKKYQLADEINQLTDCLGNPLAPGTAVVTCAAHQQELCQILGLLPYTGDFTTGTILVGSNCQLYSVPALQGVLNVLDTTTVDLTLVADVLSASVIVSPDAGNIIQVNPNGLYGDICNGISNLGLGPPTIPGVTQVVTSDCILHTLSLETLITPVDTLTVDLTVSGVADHTLQADVNISGVIGNAIIVNPDGLYVSQGAAQTPITPVDTLTVNLTVSGVDNHTLQADVNVSGFPGNDISVLADGLFLDVCAELNSLAGPFPAVPGVTNLVGSDCLKYTIPVSQNPITVLDTVTVDMTLSGGTVVSSDVNISGVPGNILSVLADGLAVRCVDVVSCVGDTIINGIPTNCINTSVVEAPVNNFTVTATPILNPAVDNQLTCTPTGLYVPQGANQVTCQNIQNLFIDSPSVLVTGERVLVDTCETKLFPSFSGITTSCITTTVLNDGLNNKLIQVNPIIAPTAVGFPANCQGLTCTANGLSVNPDHTGDGGAISTIGNIFVGPLVQGQVFISPTITLQVTNPSTCRSAVLVISTRINDTDQANGLVGPNEVLFEFFRDINFPSFTSGGFQLYNNSRFSKTEADSIQGWSASGANINVPFIIAPGETGTFSHFVTATQILGNSNAVAIGPNILRYWLYTI